MLAQHYYLYKQDFARLQKLGVKSFSPSISWPRIFPFGKGPVNADGVQHYDDVIAELVKNGITPAVSLFHWDTPLALFNEYGVRIVFFVVVGRMDDLQGRPRLVHAPWL